MKKSTKITIIVLSVLLVISAITVIIIFSSKQKAKDDKYKQALSDYENGNWMTGQSAIEELKADGYEYNEDDINEAKYNYVITNISPDADKTVKRYTRELKEINYKDAADIYEEYYVPRVEHIAINTSPDDRYTHLDSIDNDHSRYYHFTLGGLTGDDTVEAYCIIYFNSGNTLQGDTYSFNKDNNYYFTSFYTGNLDYTSIETFSVFNADTDECMATISTEVTIPDRYR